jgi:hypothetical protein
MDHQRQDLEGASGSVNRLKPLKFQEMLHFLTHIVYPLKGLKMRRKC